jgi:hypothetical protein
MRLCLSIAIPVCVLAVALRAAEIIDAIVATVDNDPILYSEWDDTVHIEAFLNARSLAEVGPAERRATLDRMIDQVLVLQQMRRSNFPPVTGAELRARVSEIRKEHPWGKTDDTWNSALKNYGITAADLDDYVQRQMSELRFIDQRFRPDLRIEPKEVESYYREEYLPKLQRAGAPPKPLTEVQDQIEQILAAQHVNQMMNTWIESLRGQARIDVRAPSQPTALDAQKTPGSAASSR